MPLLINIRHLETESLLIKGDLPSAELEMDNFDSVIHPAEKLSYDLEVQRLEHNLLIQGKLRLPLKCECVRCLKEFSCNIDFSDWACHLPLAGDDKVDVQGDFVDLTPHIREDILLALPQHPLCDVECSGLPKGSAAKVKKLSGTGKFEAKPAAWAELDKLKL